jgi:hypothetical protein
MPVQSLNWNDKIRNLSSGDNLSNSQKSSLLSLLNAAGGGLATNPGAVGNKALFDGIIAKGVGGKKSANGTATSSSTTSSYPKTISGAVGMANLTVAGLTFKPSYILIYPSNYFSHTIYDSRLDVSYAIDVMIDKNNAPTGYSLQNSSPASVTTTGFTMPVQNTSASYIWIAIE